MRTSSRNSSSNAVNVVHTSSSMSLRARTCTCMDALEMSSVLSLLFFRPCHLTHHLPFLTDLPTARQLAASVGRKLVCIGTGRCMVWDGRTCWPLVDWCAACSQSRVAVRSLRPQGFDRYVVKPSGDVDHQMMIRVVSFRFAPASLQMQGSAGARVSCVN